MIYTLTNPPTFLVQPGWAEPIVYDHRVPGPLPYSKWLEWHTSESHKQAPGRIYAHVR